MQRSARFVASFTVLFVAASAAACSATVEEDTGAGDLGESSDAVSVGCALPRSSIVSSATDSRRRAIERAFTWLDESVQYSQTRSFRGYRTDCSGFVSMAWELARSYTTADFIAERGESHLLAGGYDALVPGDALVRRAGGVGHIVLFLGWNDDAHSSACVIEQANPRVDMAFRVRAASSLRRDGFRALRADSLPAETSRTSADPPDSPQPPPEAEPAGKPAAPAPPATGGGASCVNDGQCNPGNDGSGLICESRQCVPGCRIQAHCPGVTKCVDGQCR